MSPRSKFLSLLLFWKIIVTALGGGHHVKKTSVVSVKQGNEQITAFVWQGAHVRAIRRGHTPRCEKSIRGDVERLDWASRMRKLGGLPSQLMIGGLDRRRRKLATSPSAIDVGSRKRGDERETLASRDAVCPDADGNEHASGEKIKDGRLGVGTERPIFEPKRMDGLAVVEAVGGFPFAPPMTWRKFLTMQERRVQIDIKYSGGAGLKRYYSATKNIIKKHFPDTIVNKDIVEVSSMRDQDMFEVFVDGKLAYAKRRNSASVYLQLNILEQIIKKARRRRRPGGVVYGDEETYCNARKDTTSTFELDLNAEDRG